MLKQIAACLKPHVNSFATYSYRHFEKYQLADAIRRLNDPVINKLPHYALKEIAGRFALWTFNKEFEKRVAEEVEDVLSQTSSVSDPRETKVRLTNAIVGLANIRP